MKIHFILHESFESPAAIESWARQNNHQLAYTHLYQHEGLPEDIGSFDFLIIMGGPQSPATTLQEFPYFDTLKEIRLIKNAIANNKWVLGICLGAQMIGEAYGARFEHSPNREIGVFPIQLTESGKKDAIFKVFPDEFLVGHWHGDMPGVPEGAEVLAYSEGCPRQIVRYSDKVYGFQCHFEFNLQAIEGMIANCSADLQAATILPYIQTAETLRKQDYKLINKMLYDFLDQFIMK